MTKDSGWIRLHRNSFNNPLYFSEPFTKWQAWTDLLLIANHKENVYFIRGIAVTVPRGAVGYGLDELSKRWKWSRGKTERFMKFLESKSVRQIVRQKTNVTTLISILNYDMYQTDDKTEDNTNGKANGQQTVKQTDVNKNDKNLKKEKKEESVSAAPGFFGVVYEKMMEVYLAVFPTYFKDNEKDYAACFGIAQKTEFQKGWAAGSCANGHYDEFILFWTEIVNYASNDKWLSKRSISDLNTAEWQRLGQHMRNFENGTSSKEQRKAKSEKKEPQSVSARLIAQQYD